MHEPAAARQSLYGPPSAQLAGDALAFRRTPSLKMKPILSGTHLVLSSADETPWAVASLPEPQGADFMNRIPAAIAIALAATALTTATADQRPSPDKTTTEIVEQLEQRGYGG